MRDPIETEIFKNLFVSICEEMGISLMKTAFSPNIKERRDYSTAVFDLNGETIAQGDHMPVHLGAMPISVQTVIKNVSLAEGDMVLLNDPFQGGTHLPDLTLVMPLFFRSRPLFYVANRAHHADVGGIAAGSMPVATEIFQEGLIIPPVKILKRHKLDKDVLALLLSNVRTPDERLGDLKAQMAANLVGSRALLRLLEKYGAEKTLRLGRELQDYSAKMMRHALGRIKPGCYRAVDWLDDDGQGQTRIPIAVKISLRHGAAEIDFSESGPQTAGNINANYAVTFAATVYVFRCLIGEDVPYNSGVYRPLRVRTKAGTVVDATFPAAVAGGNVETSQRIVDVVLRALQPAVPDLVPAAAQGTMNNISFGGSYAGGRFAYYETLGGGTGAAQLRPGLNGVHSHMTNSLNTPIEALENYLPVRITRYELRRNSGGQGRQRGGDGLVREYEFLTPVQVTVLSERREMGPYGLAGGSAGQPGINEVLSEGRSRRLPGKFSLTLKAGERLRIQTPGGGGYGAPENGQKKDVAP